MPNNLDAVYLAYTTTQRDLDTLLASVRKYALSQARRHRCHDPEDIAQEITIKVFKGIVRSQYRARASFTTWVHRIARNHILVEQRPTKEATATAMGVESHELDTMPHEATQVLPPIYEVADLDERDREVVSVLNTTLDFEATARQLGITPKSLRSKLERIRAKREKSLGF